MAFEHPVDPTTPGERTFCRHQAEHADNHHVRRALTALRESTQVDLAFGGTVMGGRHVRLSEMVGTSRGAMRGVTVLFGQGLGGKAVALRRPVAVNDYGPAKGISHHYNHVVAAEGLRAMVAAPVVVNKTVRAVLYGAIRQAVPLGDRTLDAVRDTARDLGHHFAVQDEVVRRLTGLERDTETIEGSAPVSSPEWETVREAYAELRILAHQITDPGIRERVDATCEKLAAARNPSASGLPSAPTVSARELDVLACVALGWTNSDIAEALGLRSETVKSYLRSAMHRLGCHSRLDVVATARDLGLLP